MAEAKGAHISHFNLKIDGAQAPKELMDQILECTVENSIHLPDMCTIRLHDAKFKYIDEAVLDPGKKVEIYASNEQMPTLVKIFCGEVTGIDVDLPADMTPTLTVRAFDYAHRLQRGRSTRTFNQMTDTDIVNKVAKEAGFTVHADSTSQVHEWTIQKNESNWEFLQKRADKNGYRLYVNDEKDLYFCKVDNDKVGPYSASGDGSGDPMHPDRQDDSAGVIKVEWGKSLRSFSPKVVASKQVNQVVVKGWDPKSKRPIVGQADTAKGVPQVGMPKNGSAAASSAYGDAKMVVTDRPVNTQQEADDLAQSVCDGIGGGYLEAEGVCYGVPTLRAGKTISIPNIGKRFSGKYHVSAVTHTYTPAEGYKTDFSVSAKKPADLLSVISGDSSDPTTAGGDTGSGSGGNGIVVGIVTDNNDPENQGRVKVKYPWLSDDDTSTWVRIVSPMAGSGRGFEFLPEIDDEVLVAFEHGDPHRAYVLGALWNGTDSPPLTSAKAVEGGKIVRRVIRSRTGHELFFLETSEKQGFAINTAAGHKFELRDSDKFIRVITNLGNVVELNDAEGYILLKDMTGLNSIEITREGQITLQAVGQISIQAGGTIQIQSGAATSVVSGMAFSVESGAALSLTSGAALTASSGAALALSAGAALAISAGAAAAISSTGATAITAGAALALTGTAIPMTGVVTANGLPVV